MVELIFKSIEMVSVSNNESRIDLGIQEANVPGFLKTLSRRDGFLPVGLVMYQWDMETGIYSVASLPFYAELVQSDMLSKYLRTYMSRDLTWSLRMG